MKKTILNFGLAILSSLLFALSFPSAGIFPLMFISIILLLLVLEQFASSSRAAWAGFLWGYAGGVFTLYWLVYTLGTYGEMHWLLALITFLLMNAYLSIYPAGLFYILYRMRPLNDSLWKPAAAAALFTAMEYLRGNVLTGFPWTNIGYALAQWKIYAQAADLGGVYLLTFVTVFISAHGYCALSSISNKKSRNKISHFALCACGLALLLLYGAYAQLAYQQSSSSRKIAFAVIQGNIDQAQKWDPAYRRATVDKYQRLTLSALRKGPVDLVIWPETATPFFFRHSFTWKDTIKDFVRSISTPLFFGTPDYEFTKGRIRYLNTALLLLPSGEIKGMYRKVHLVPFGEFIPLYDYLKFLAKLFPAAGIFSSGTTPAPVPWNSTILAPLICYEAIFPELTRIQVREGAAFLINITNDAWFGKTSAPYQHFNISALRAIEMRRPLVRAANTGISGAVDPSGHMLFSTSIFTDAAERVEVRVPLMKKTLYLVWGDWFALLCLFVSGFVMLRLWSHEKTWQVIISTRRHDGNTA